MSTNHLAPTAAGTKARVLHVIDTTGPGGAETVFIDLVTGLKAEGFQPVVILRGEGWVSKKLMESGITPNYFDSRGGLNVSYLRKIVQTIIKERIDLIQSHLLGSNLYCSLAGVICGRPVVSTFHGFVDVSAKERFAAAKKKIINHASSRIVFVSDSLRDSFCRDGFSRKRSEIIHNGVDLSAFRPGKDSSLREKVGIGPGKILVGAVGNIRPAKGYQYLLQAAKLVLDASPDFRFVVAGEGGGARLQTLMELRDELGLQDRFFFLGFQPDISKVLHNLDIFVLPSVSEGFSISTIEAMACGVPVIATRSGGPEEIITDGVTGLLASPGCPSSLAEQILTLQRDQSLKRDLRQNALSHVRKRYSRESMLNSYATIYQTLIGKK